MAKFSARSLAKLDTCHPDLQRLFKSVIEDYDCAIIEGHRSWARQLQLRAQGRSRTLRSKHLYSPSRAVDVAPWSLERRGIDWDDLAEFYQFGEFVLKRAAELDITVRWGGDWDRDGDYRDQSFNDLVHFELVG